VKQVRRAIERGTLTRGADGKLDAADLGTTWRRANRRTQQRAPQMSQDIEAKADTAASLDEALRLYERQAAALNSAVYTWFGTLNHLRNPLSVWRRSLVAHSEAIEAIRSHCCAITP
jgi:hypothetical protein